ncbi:MAG: hypothetical protein ABIL09_27855 [Gemmatimonadota bacterium]
MALEFQNLFVPVATGLDQSIDSRLLPPGQLINCKNGVFTKKGAITKRNGFTQISTLTSAGGAATVPASRQLFSTGDELCIVSDYRLWSRNNTDALWYDRGTVSPFVGHQETMFRGARSYNQCDIDVLGNYQILVAQSERQTSDDPSVSANREQAMVIATRTISDQTIIPPTDYGVGNMGAAGAHSVRACRCTGKLLALCLRGYSPAGGGVPLELYEYPTATPTTAPVLVGNVHPTAWVPVPTSDANNIRSYDAIPLANGDWLVAYIDNAGGAVDRDIIVERRSPAHAILSTVTFVGTAYRVALAEDAAGGIYVLWADAATASLLLYKYNAALVTQWATTVNASGGGEEYDSVGLVVGPTNVLCAWSYYTAATNDYFRTHNRLVAAATGVAGSLDTAFDNVQLRSRPFLVDGRCYAFVQTACKDALFEANAVLDLDIDRDLPGAYGTEQQLVGVFNVGNAPAWQTSQMAFSVGSTANVVLVDGKYCTGAAATAYHMNNTAWERFMCSVVGLEFGAPVGVARVTKGAVIIGGGVCSWYVSGNKAVELGIITPPTITTPVEYNTAMTPGLAIGSVQAYSAIWESYDARGSMSRSAPSIPFARTFVGAGADDGSHIWARQVGLTNRFGVYGMAPQVFRADSLTGQFTRITEPRRGNLNIRGYEQILVTDDYGQTGSDLLYVMGGEIENVMPNGCRLVATVGERIWLGDSYAKEWMQFSKLYTPGTVTETPYAPEFNEGFGFLAPRGEQVTGIAPLGDVAVLFTTSSTYAVAGSGPDDAGLSNDFSRMTPIAPSLGCIDFRSVVAFPGGVFFQSEDGLYLIGQGHNFTRMAAVEDILATYPTVTSAETIVEKHQVRFTVTNAAGTAGRVLVFDYVHGAWTYFDVLTAAGGSHAFIDACWHDGVYYALKADGTLWYEDASSYVDSATQYIPLDIESAWLQPAQQGGWSRVRYASILGQLLDPCDLTVEVFNDFETSASQTVLWDAPTIAAWPTPNRLQPAVHVARQTCQAVKIRVYDSADATTVTSQGYTLEGFTLNAALKRGLARVSTTQRN